MLLLKMYPGCFLSLSINISSHLSETWADNDDLEVVNGDNDDLEVVSGDNDDLEEVSGDNDEDKTLTCLYYLK